MEMIVDYRIGGIPRYRLVDEDDTMQIPDEVRKCVAFVCFRDNDGIKLAGTAFLFSVLIGDGTRMSTYFVTAKHVIDGISKKTVDQKVMLRLNTKDEGAKLIESPIDKWLFHPFESNVDVAVLSWSPSQEVFDYKVIPIEMAATREVIGKEKISIGDDVFLTGLFKNHYGQERNIPIIRVGNIAAMPEEKVHTKKMGDVEAFLIESRSIGGLSGSPVFAYVGSLRRYDKGYQLGRKGFAFYLLGLMHGHYDLEHMELDGIKEDTLYNLEVNLGIAIVIPIWKILEVINQKIFVAARELAWKQYKEKFLPTPDNNKLN